MKLNDKIINPDRITNLQLTKWKSQGLTPYRLNSDIENYGLSEITTAIMNNGTLVYLLTEENKIKIDKVCEYIKETINLKLKSIKLLQQYGKAFASEILS
jgi:hypothetical protein